MTTATTHDLFAPATLGDLTLANRVVMAPMTRSRAEGNVPNALMAEYYGQRAGAGLLITEGTAPHPDGLGYARIPGLFNEAQVQGWKLVADALHAKGSHIFVQLMHTGRVSHPANLPAGAAVLAPSAVQAKGDMWTDTEGMQPLPLPRAMTLPELQAAKAAFVQAAKLARQAGLDGVELHAANGYLLEQFLNPGTNQRTDAYGGSLEARCRFVLEVAKETAAAIGAGRVGIRLSPFGVFNDMPAYDEVEATYLHLAKELSALGLAYIHIVDHSSMGAPEVPASLKAALRAAFAGATILSGGYDLARAQADLAAGKGDFIAFGRPFIANPDLVARLKGGLPLAEPKPDTFYTPGAAGYTDYPASA
ncbi:MAG TPA: alkene reductase [Holophagaceae bacterium]|nr:alkene reductase [Holophagaceae bacterium]